MKVFFANFASAPPLTYILPSNGRSPSEACWSSEKFPGSADAPRGKTWFCSEIFKEDDILVFVLPWSWRQYCRQSFNIFLTNALRASRPRSWTCAVIFALPLHIIYKQNWRSCLATKPCNSWALIHCRSSAITHSSCHCCPAITIWWLHTSPYRTTHHTTTKDTSRQPRRRKETITRSHLL